MVSELQSKENRFRILLITSMTSPASSPADTSSAIVDASSAGTDGSLARSIMAVLSGSPSLMAGLASSSAGAAIISPRDLAASITIKLTGENYLYWHAQVAPLLRSFGLMGYVDGSELCPADMITVDVSGKPVQQLNPDAQRWAK
jgi:hypothetical protein